MGGQPKIAGRELQKDASPFATFRKATYLTKEVLSTY